MTGYDDELRGGACGGIPFLSEQEGLPCEDELLNAVSPRTPAEINVRIDDSVNRDARRSDPVFKSIENLQSLSSDFDIDQDMSIGVDVGLSSCGVAIIEGQAVSHLNVRLFDSNYLPQKTETKTGNRRNKRAQRRRLHRQAGRRRALRRLLFANGMWPANHRFSSTDKYNLIVHGLDFLLEPAAFGVALFHTVRRRGYVPRRHAEGEIEPALTDGVDPDAGPLLTAVGRNRLRAGNYRTAGEMLQKDPVFADRKRNRFGDFRSALPRDLVMQEVEALFAAQRSLGSAYASKAFEKAFSDIAFYQAPRRSNGIQRCCPYLPAQRVGVQRAPSIELFAYLDRLTKLWIEDGVEIRRLSESELERAISRFGRTLSVTFLDLRRWLVLADTDRFVGIFREEADIVSRNGAAYGTVMLRSILGRARWQEIDADAGLGDAIAEALTLAGDEADLAERLSLMALPAGAADLLQKAYIEGELDGFSGAARVSADAARKMTPFLAEGHLVFDAAIKAGFDPLSKDSRILYMTRPARLERPILEAIKQVSALIADIGKIPGRIHVEVAQELALTPAQWAIGQELQKKADEARRAARQTLTEVLPAQEVSGSLVERYLLWQEQGGRCIYSGTEIPIQALVDGNAVQVDHVLPASRSGDHSRNNRVICLSSANQEKGNRTPFEWFGGDQEAWRLFSARIKAMPLAAWKRKLVLMQGFANHEGRVLVRNLNDTSFAARSIIGALRSLYPRAEAYRRVVARPGQLTAVLRRSWGFTKDRSDVRSHALDALMVAVADDRTFYRLANGRRSGNGAYGTAVPLPWPGFYPDAMAALSETKVSRSEKKRGRGAAHGETIRRFRY